MKTSPLFKTKDSPRAKHAKGETPALARQPEALRDLARQVVASARPLKVILFGSRARGDAGSDSDYDLMIVMPDGTHRRHIRQKLHREVLVMEISYDLLVATPEDFKKYGYHPSLIYKHVLDEGVELYVA